jgi:hypothetical protein
MRIWDEVGTAIIAGSGRQGMARASLNVLQSNEKVKAWSAIGANLGTALLIAGFGSLWLSGPEPWPILWIAFGFALMAFATHLLNYLQEEG